MRKEENNNHISQVISFIMEIDKLKSVTRKVKPLSNERYENSAEHSWHIAMLALSLAPFADEQINMNHVVKMLLVHDIGEIDTGDTLFFVEGGWEERKQAELLGVKRIFSYLPDNVSNTFLELWIEFENGETLNSRFANAIDRAMPVLLNLENNGQSWKENKVSYDRVVSKIKPPIQEGFPYLWEYLEVRLFKARQKGYFWDS